MPKHGWVTVNLPMCLLDSVPFCQVQFQTCKLQPRKYTVWILREHSGPFKRKSLSWNGNKFWKKQVKCTEEIKEQFWVCVMSYFGSKVYILKYDFLSEDNERPEEKSQNESILILLVCFFLVERMISDKIKASTFCNFSVFLSSSLYDNINWFLSLVSLCLYLVYMLYVSKLRVLKVFSYFLWAKSDTLAFDNSMTFRDRLYSTNYSKYNLVFSSFFITNTW